MITEYLFSAPKGDIPVGPDELISPFRLTPSKNHSFLTLGNYFDSIKSFILRDNGITLSRVLGGLLGERISLNSIHKILIRSEKHGVLYHVASAEFFFKGHTIKLAVSTAVSEKGKMWLDREYNVLNYLRGTFNLPYLPKPYFKGEIEQQVGADKVVMAMFITDWFEDYHEWHLSNDEDMRGQRVCIWDTKNGNRFATREESSEIFKQASKILTLYYNTQDFSQVYPWHHAAGDFVVKSKDGVIKIKLASARGYKPVMVFMSEEALNPMVSLIYFFLDLTMKMRLDKLDGVGETVWADDFSVNATTTGFFDGLLIMESEGRYNLGSVEDLLSLLKGFNGDELRKLYDSLLDLYRDKDPGDLAVIQANLDKHIRHLHHVVQRFRL